MRSFFLGFLLFVSAGAASAQIPHAHVECPDLSGTFFVRDLRTGSVEEVTLLSGLEFGRTGTPFLRIEGLSGVPSFVLLDGAWKRGFLGETELRGACHRSIVEVRQVVAGRTRGYLLSLDDHRNLNIVSLESGEVAKGHRRIGTPSSPIFIISENESSENQEEIP